MRFGGYCTPAVQLKSKRGLSGLSAGGLIALDPFTRIRHLPFQGRVPRSSNSRSPSAAYRESAPPVCGALRFFSRPALAQGDGNSSTASPSWRGTRSGWRCPSSAGIAGLWPFPCFSPSRRLSAAGGFGCGCWFSFQLTGRSPPPFFKFFRIMGFAVFSWQIPASKEVTCLILLNHLLTFLPAWVWGGPRSAPCAGAMMEWFGCGAQGQMSQWGCGKLTGGYALSLAGC